MRAVQLKINLGIIKYSIKRLLPTCWEEVSRRQALAFAATVTMRLHEIFGRDEDGNDVLKDEKLYFAAKSALLFYMLRIRFWIFNFIHPEIIADLLEEKQVADFFFTGKITRNYFPFLRRNIFCRKYFAPQSLHKLSGEEFSFADGYFIKYKSGDAEALDFFIATLYRRRKKYSRNSPFWNGDVREDFNRITIDFRLPMAAALHPAVKILIASWYEALRQDWEEEFPHVFRGGGSGEHSNKTWIDVLIGLSGSKFGAFSQTTATPMYIILKEAEELLLQQEKYKPEN